VMIWFLEDYRDDVVLVVRVQHFELPDPTGLRHRHGHCVTQTTTQNWNQPCALLPRVRPAIGLARVCPGPSRVLLASGPVLTGWWRRVGRGGGRPATRALAGAVPRRSGYPMLLST
jgi:hypothetical protein